MLLPRSKLCVCFLLLASVGLARADKSAVLHLGDKDFLSGELQDSDANDSLRWQSTVATSSFDFPLERISAIHFPPQENPQISLGDYALELSGGDRLFGKLLGITADKIEFDALPLGKLQIDRNQVVRIIHRDAARDWVYMGPNGLAEWKQPGENSLWREEAGHLISETAAASVRHDGAIPEQASIEFEISWKKKPDFVFTFGSSLERRAEQKVLIRRQAGPAKEDGKAESTGYRFEVWEKTLVIVSERGTEADVAVVALLEAEGRLHLRAYLDQKSGKFSVYSLQGKQLAQIEVPSSEPATGIELRNKTGDIRLEQLSISTWDGRLPVEVSLNEAYVLRTDGIVLDGKVTAFDSDSKQFVISTPDGEQQIDASNIATVLISPQAQPPSGPLRAVLHTGVSITGSLDNVRGGKLHLSRSGVEETLAIPVSEVRSLLGPGKLNLTPPDSVRVGRLEMEGVRSHGWLIDGTGNAGGSCLVWHPRQAANSSPLLEGLSGRLVYRDPPPPKPNLTSTRNQPQQRQQPRPGVWGGVLDVFGVRKNPQPKPVKEPVARQSLIHLRAGDNVPCQVTSVDEEGVYIASAVVEAKFIPHEQIKAIELSTGVTLPEIDEKKRQRLLTLPRMQRNNPPTHLLIGTNGDILRGRLQEMSEETVAVEIHLETRDLPREQVASIIWLHKTELVADPAQKTSSQNSAPLVQALRPDGIRLTFTPHEAIDNALVGTSDILGACRVDLQTVDMLLMGGAIQAATDEREYHTWKLTHAADPKYLTEDANATGSVRPVTSGLIGQPAPEVKLKLASGKQFLLSKEKGHVVVLDFWASWCGPCMQAMPMVDEVVKEFEAKGVKLVAVNMQEDEATVKSALERLKLNSTVALDIDGATAEKYQVTAIPQTVIIDADGKVAKLFVGGGSQLGEQLRDALQELIAADEKME